MKGVARLVNCIVMTGKKELERCSGANADTDGLGGRASEREVFHGRTGERGERGGEREAHAVEAGKVIGARADIGPRDEEVAERGRIHRGSQAGAGAGCKCGGAGGLAWFPSSNTRNTGRKSLLVGKFFEPQKPSAAHWLFLHALAIPEHGPR